jgi:hypothetical protein
MAYGSLYEAAVKLILAVVVVRGEQGQEEAEQRNHRR